MVCDKQTIKRHQYNDKNNDKHNSNKTDIGTPNNPWLPQIHKAQHDQQLRQRITDLPSFEFFNIENQII